MYKFERIAMLINRDNCVLLQIDIQDKLVPAMLEGEYVIENCTKLIKGLKLFNVPMIITEQYPKGLGNTVNTLISELDEQYIPIEKTSFSCMKNENFVEMLENYGKKNILITGMESHICVLQTVLELKTAGYNPIVVEDCICSRRDNDHYIALERMLKEKITITTYESILMEVCGRSDIPEFKAISKIIK